MLLGAAFWSRSNSGPWEWPGAEVRGVMYPWRRHEGLQRGRWPKVGWEASSMCLHDLSPRWLTP